MAKSNEATLREIEKEAKKLKKALKRADLDYTVQISMNSAQPGAVHYALSMTAPAKGLAPIMFVTSTPERLLEMIKAAQTNFDANAVEKAYHESQIKACENTILGHKERLEEMEKEEAEGSEEIEK